MAPSSSHAAHRSRVSILVTALVALAAACNSSPPPLTPAPPPVGPIGSAAPSASTAPPPAAAYKDPTESAGAIRLTPLFTADAPPAFPAPTTSDIGCLGHAKLTGNNAKDYPAVVAACGAPAGLAEYTKPVSGMLHSSLDQQDSYVVLLAAGYCYRVFAAGDQSIFDLGLSIQPITGGTATEDGARGNVAILDDDRPVCVDKAGDFAIKLAIEGMGYGGYTLGVWARPKT